MKSEITKQEDNTLILKITIPWSEVEKTRTETEAELVKNVSMPGFRKGKTPQNIAKAKLDREKVKEEMLKKILPKYYVDALKQNNLNTIISPNIHVEAFDEGTDLVFTAQTCEEPEVNLNNYKDEVQKFTAPSKIVVPGKEQKKPSLDEIIDIILKNTKILIPKILVDRETNRLLSGLLDEIKTLGLNLDQYLSSRGKTADNLRQEYEEKAQKDLQIEFLLRKIADTEKITVEKKDLDEALSTIKDEKQKKSVSENPYLLASIIRQQKTLDHLGKI